MQRYAAFLWSGDVLLDVGDAEDARAGRGQHGLSGIPYWGTDIGGFVPTAEYTGELYVRWFQFGAFCPLFRSHGRTWHLRLPWGWNTRRAAARTKSANFPGADPRPSCTTPRSSRSAGSISSCAIG